MHHIIKLVTFISIMTLFLVSCEKETLNDCINDPDCEYFRCKVNGEWWTPDCEQGPLFGCRHTDVQYYKDSRGGSIEMTSSSKKQNDGFYIRCLNIKETDINNSFAINNKIYTKYFNSSNMFFVDSTKHSEFILTHLDTISFSISAKFSFIGKDENGQTVSITNGEFRQKYRF